ncbi:MAG: UDP-N-acetyl-D-mannosamine dehydrogenase [Xanthomonadales bacterium]|nr:UDP-N-acetyl-D-mannosamine dehydrogenase [Xanthomonadales bacterium]
MNSRAPESLKKVCILGLGYIGLPTAAVFASRGLQVIGVDVNPQIVETINAGNVHIEEPDLDIIVRSVVLSGNLRAATSPEPADAFIVAVPTPFMEGHKPDMSYIKSAADSLAPVLRKGNLVILESTSPVGATEQLGTWLAERRPDLRFPQPGQSDADIHLAHCPERVLPGQVLTELVENDRVIGGTTPQSVKLATALYKTFVKGECVATDVRTAELAKLTENAFRDVNIAFANELSLICDRLNIDVWELISLANRHPRVNILQPGPGVGGHCIAVDPWFIVDSAPEQARLIHTARMVNDSKPGFVVDKIRAAAKGANNPVVACLGLAFKPNIDDLRESPAVEVVRHIAGTTNLQVLAVEPHVQELPEALKGLRNVRLVSVEDAIAQATVIALLVDHDAFRQIDRSQLADKSIVDTRGFWR